MKITIRPFAALTALVALLVTAPAGMAQVQDAEDCTRLQDPLWFCAPVSDWIPIDDEQSETLASYLSAGIYAQILADPIGRGVGMTEDAMVRAFYENFSAAIPGANLERLAEETDMVDGLPGRFVLVRVTTPQTAANFAATIVVTDTHTFRFLTQIAVPAVTDFRLDRHRDFLAAIRIDNPDD